MIAGLWWLAACGGAPPEASSVPPEPVAQVAQADRRLVLFISVDQLPVRLLARAQPMLSPNGGFARLSRGFSATARHAHSDTTTCAGHATLSTGASPTKSGVIGNYWKGGDKLVYCVDPDGDGVMDVGALRADAAADRVIDAGGRVVSVGLKDRSPLMLGGHRPSAVVFIDKEKQAFRGAPFAESVPVQLGSPWTLSADVAHPGPDAGPFEMDRCGTAFPHPTDSLDCWLRSPQSGTALTDVALAALTAYHLGDGQQPDLLAVAYSHIDYIGHTYTAESWESLDAILQLDRDLGRLLDGAEAAAPGRWAAVLSSDHGAIPGDGPRVQVQPALAAARKAAVAAGAPDAELMFDPPNVWLPSGTDAAVREAASQAVAQAFRAQAGVAGAWAWRTDAPPAAVSLSTDPERSGDVYVLLNEATQWQDGPAVGTEHGLPYDHDQLVPLLAVGAGVRSGVASGEVDTRQVAPAVTALLGVPPPRDAERSAPPELLAGPP